MPDEPALREHARQALQENKMPNRQPDRLWGGPGVEAPCAICNKPVRKDEMEFEVQFSIDGGAKSPHFAVFHIHIRCFSAWELVRSKVDGHRPPQQS